MVKSKCLDRLKRLQTRIKIKLAISVISLETQYTDDVSMSIKIRGSQRVR